VKAGVAYSVINTTYVPESITISIYGLKNKITIVNAYHPPSKPLHRSIYSRFFNGRSAIVLGDFNSHSTLFATGSTSHLDLSMAPAPLGRRCTCTVLDDFMEVLITILITIEKAVSVEASFVPKWIHRKADWVAFKADCTLIWSLVTSK